jgi:Lipocalin-like domain
VSPDPRTAILGTWRLVHSVEYGPGGERHYPFGEDAIGYIIYSESGVMAVQIGRRGRRIVGANPVIGKKDYLAYFGRYELDLQNAVVRHLLEGELFPGHAEDLERKYHFFDEKLSLKPVDGTNREILWQRM